MLAASLASSNVVYNLCGLNLFTEELIAGFECYQGRNPTSSQDTHLGNFQLQEESSDGFKKIT